MITPSFRLISSSLAILALCASSNRLHAASATWTGANSGVWNDAGNWSPSIPGTPGGATTDAATFNNSTNTAITVDANRTVGQMQFDTGAGGFRFTGGPLILSGTGATAAQIILSAGTNRSQTFDSNITLSTQTSITFSNASTTAGTVFNLNGNLTTRPTGGNINFNGAGTGIIVRGNITDNGAGVTNIAKDFNQSNTLILKGNNSYTGLTSLVRGEVYFDSVSMVGGGSSSFGAQTTAANAKITVAASTTSAEFSLVYTGTGSTTDRAIDIAPGASATMGANLTTYGTGALQWDGGISSSGSSGVTHSFTLAGANTSENRVGGVISNSASSGATSLTKSGQSTWNLTGANTYTGNTNIGEGLLRLDFSNALAPATNIISSSSALVMEGGTLALRGKASGVSSQTVNNLTLNVGHSKILADGNGGTSTTLALGAITRSGTGATLDVSLASTGAVTTTTSTMTNSVISNGGVAYATVNGSDWATYNAGNIEALSTYQTATNPGSWASTDNVSLSGNPSANVGTQSINTLRLDAASTVTITAGQTLTVGAGGILMTGTGNTLITSGTLKGSGSATKELVVYQNKSSGTAEISSVIADNTAATTFTKAGNGTLTLSGSNTYTGNTVISGGVLKVAGVANYANRGIVFSGGVLGLSGGDLTGLTLGVGAANRVSWTNSGGFAAYGADRTVSFTTAPVWGSTGNFLGTQDALKLSAADSDAKIIFASGINLQNAGSTTVAPKQIEVANGGAAVDAEISGVLSSGSPNGGLVKTGAGTLLLSNTNTYGGVTYISAGTLIVNGSIGNSMLTTVASGATLAGTGTTAQIEIMAGGAIAPGNGIGGLNVSQNGNSDLVWNGETSGSFGQMKFELASGSSSSDQLNLGVGMLNKGSGTTFTFDFLGTGGASQTYTLINFGSTDFTVGDFSYTNLSSGLTGTFSLSGSTLQFTTVPEPATLGMVAFSLTTMLMLRRRKRD